MQDLTEDQLKEIERLGALMFSTGEICLIMALCSSEDAADTQYHSHDAFQTARRRGKLKEEAAVRTSIFELAKAGSAPAQTLAKQLMDQARVFAAGV